MLKLSIMSEEELTHIFGNLDAYIPLHEDLLAQLSKATGPDGTVGQIGQIVVSWVSVRASYTSISLILLKVWVSSLAGSISKSVPVHSSCRG